MTKTKRPEPPPGTIAVTCAHCGIGFECQPDGAAGFHNDEPFYLCGPCQIAACGPDDYPETEGPACKKCGEPMEWVECPDCGGEGYGEEFHDCGEDCCCCADPDPGPCPTCHGQGGWHTCFNKSCDKFTETLPALPK